jgi:hypothetical protein
MWPKEWLKENDEIRVRRKPARVMCIRVGRGVAFMYRLAASKRLLLTGMQCNITFRSSDQQVPHQRKHSSALLSTSVISVMGASKGETARKFASRLMFKSCKITLELLFIYVEILLVPHIKIIYVLY